MTSVDLRHRLRVGLGTAVPQSLLPQLLALEESVRLEIAHTLLESVDASVDCEMSDDQRKRLDAALDRSIARSPEPMPARESRSSKPSPRSAPDERRAPAQLADVIADSISRTSEPARGDPLAGRELRYTRGSARKAVQSIEPARHHQRHRGDR